MTKPRKILALVGELLDEGQEARGVLVHDEVAEAKERLFLDGAEELEDVLHGDRAVGGRGELVEGRDGVAEAAARAPGDEGESGVGHVDLLPVGDAAQELRELGEPRSREEKGLAAGANRREHLPEVGSAEDEDEVRGRLLDQLEEGVEGGLGELVRLVEDVDLVAALDRLEDHVLADLAHVVDPALARRVHLDDVERGAGCDRAAGVAGAVRLRGRALLAVERLGEDAGERGLPRAARAGEEVRLPHLVSLDRVLERADDRFLADDLVEVLRPVLPVERRHERSIVKEPGRAPAVEETLEAVPATLARARSPRGTWERLLSAASSRT